jgi:hypothetical protein
MAYIVNLIVILYGISRAAGTNTMENTAQEVMRDHIKSSGRRDSINGDIRRFVTETFPTRFAIPQKDSVVEKIIELIRQYCAPP